jgi:hypothetical protein
MNGSFRLEHRTMIATASILRLQRAGMGGLRPCPFCGGEATVQTSPWLDESIRVACGNDECRVQPRTEYLLACYAGELRDAWNGRP